jgi:alpha-1,3-fucosyltransferase
MTHDLDKERNLVNLTMTYRVDSDIIYPYAEVMDKVTGHVIAPGHNIKWRQPEDNFTGLKY